jgi:hypothetical protein
MQIRSLSKVSTERLWSANKGCVVFAVMRLDESKRTRERGETLIERIARRGERNAKGAAAGN